VGCWRIIAISPTTRPSRLGAVVGANAWLRQLCLADALECRAVTAIRGTVMALILDFPQRGNSGVYSLPERNSPQTASQDRRFQ